MPDKSTLVQHIQSANNGDKVFVGVNGFLGNCYDAHCFVYH